MTVRVWTSLDADALDESFAIDNVVIQLLGKGNSGEICCQETAIRNALVDLKNVTVYTPALASSLFQPVLPVAVATTSMMSTATH